MSQPSSTPAANDAGKPASAAPATSSAAAPPPSFRAQGTLMGTVLSRLGPILLVLLLVAVGVLFYLQNRVQTQNQADDLLAQKIYEVAKETEAEQRIAGYNELLDQAENKSHPYWTDVRMSLVNEYFDIITSFDSPMVTKPEQRQAYRGKVDALVTAIVQRPEVDQRTMLAYYRRGQLEEDDHQYAKAIDDYKGAATAATTQIVSMPTMAKLMSYRTANCYYRMSLTAPAGEKAGYQAKAREALNEASRSDEVLKSYGRQIDFLRREVSEPGDLLQKLPDRGPRTPVEGAPAAGGAPAGAAPAPAPVVNPAAPTDGGTVVPAAPPVAPAGPVPAPGVPTPAAPVPAPAPVAPVPAPATAPAPTPAPGAPAGTAPHK